MPSRPILNVLGAFAIQCCNGGLYAWSAFVPALRADYDLSLTLAAVIFSTTMACFTVTMVIAGPLQQRHGPRGPVLLSAVLFAVGYQVAAHSQGSFPALLLGLGVLGGTAIGLGYVSAIGTCARWFPGNCGLITGIVVAGFGLSGLAVSQAVTAQLTAGADVLFLLGHVGLFYAVVVFISGLFMSVPKHDTQPTNQPAAEKVRRPLQMPGNAGTWSLMVGMFAGTFGGLLVISNLNPMLLAQGASMQTATWAVGAFALGNAAGRILWGRLADRIGEASIMASLLCLVGALALLAAVTSPAMQMVAAAVLGLCFGAAFVVYAAQVVREHGPSGLGTVYPWVFLSYGLAGIAGPAFGGWLADTLGDYQQATRLATAVTGLGIPFALLLRRRAVAVVHENA